MDIRVIPLATLDGLDALRVVEGELRLSALPMTDLQGLGQLETVGSLVISGNHELTSFRALTSLRRVAGSLVVRGNAQLPRAEYDWLLDRIEVEGQTYYEP
ncbi:MAG: hypothetical protein KC933_20735 [Myxococcales bacterium]|nr:hypothetical protein [Myxococcales bacterium]MCB9652033.1 hypothetical protein [Deltaproteobacteria bacterium]